MAASQTEMWTVIILPMEYENFNKIYQVSPETTLKEMMYKWMNEFELFGSWMFISTNEEIAFRNDWMSLESIGETVPNSKVVTLKVQLSEEPIQRAVYVCAKDKCHLLQVKSHNKLCKVFRCLSEKPSVLLYNGNSLNLNDTIEEARLLNNTCLLTSFHQVSVRLSNGDTTLIQLPSESLVLQLEEKVNLYEKDAFSLTYQRRHLDSQESIRDLRNVIEVSRSEFVVHINGHRVNWTTKGESITFPEFLSQLKDKEEIDDESLETMDFYCVGCRRRIRKCDDVQITPVQCCKEKSLTLIAKSSFNLRTKDIDKGIQDLHDHILCYRGKHQRTEGMIGQCYENCRRCISELDDILKTLEAYIEILRIKNVELNEEIETLKIANKESVNIIEILKKENDKLMEEKQSQGTTATSGLAIEPIKRPGVELIVFYDKWKFSPLPRPEIQNTGEYAWYLPYIKCRISELVPGWTPFEAVVAAVSPLFTAHQGEIAALYQLSGEKAMREIVEVNTRNDETMEDWKLKVFCNIAGEQYTWEDVGNPMNGCRIAAGDNIGLVDGGRRTVMTIDN